MLDNSYSYNISASMHDGWLVGQCVSSRLQEQMLHNKVEVLNCWMALMCNRLFFKGKT